MARMRATRRVKMKVTRGNVEGNKEEGNQHAGLVKNTDNSDNYAFDLSSESEDVVR